MWVKDLEKMKAFYEYYFSAKAGNIYENKSKGFSSYFLSFDGGCRLEIMKMDSIKEKPSSPEYNYGFTHLAISTGSESSVKDLTEKLRSAGYQIFSEPRWTGDGYFESVILDPENNSIEITV